PPPTLYPPSLHDALPISIPKTTRVAILWNPTNPVKVADAREVQTAGSALGIRVLSVEARNASDLEPGFAAMARERVDALLVSDEDRKSTRLNSSHVSISY